MRQSIVNILSHCFSVPRRGSLNVYYQKWSLQIAQPGRPDSHVSCRARAYLEFAQETRFFPYLPSSLTEVLRSTIEAHHYALHLDPQNTDILFNTGQALSCLAEELFEQDDGRGEVISLSIEAFNVYTECLHQQRNAIQRQEAEKEVQMDRGEESYQELYDDTQMDIEQDSDQNEEHAAKDNRPQLNVRATVIDPTTEDDIVDTALAELSILTFLCTLYTSPSNADAATGPDPDDLEKSVSKLITDTRLLPIQPTSTPQSTTRETEIKLSIATFHTALATAHYRCHRISPAN